MSLPAGTYYIGDLCYVLNSRWNDVCDVVISGQSCLDGEHATSNFDFAMYSTAHGDGEYRDIEGRRYCVDSGSIGAVLLENCDKTRSEIEEEGLGHIIEFTSRMSSYSINGVITFRSSREHIEINTEY